MNIAYAPLRVNEEKQDANPPYPNQMFIVHSKKIPVSLFSKGKPLRDKFKSKSVHFIPFGWVSSVPNGNCRPGVSKGK